MRLILEYFLLTFLSNVLTFVNDSGMINAGGEVLCQSKT